MGKMPFTPATVFKSRSTLCCAVLVCGLAVVSMAADKEPIDWAKEREHWSFKAPHPSPVPAVKDKSWPRQKLDYFILAKQEAANLTPSREADRRTLIRRVSEDITGLPPTPAEAAATFSALIPRLARKTMISLASLSSTPLTMTLFV